MTVSFYVSVSHGNGKDYEHSYERRAAIHVAQDFYQRYKDSDKHYALIFNPQHPEPIDLIVITNDGLGVVDFKNCDGAMRGVISMNADTPWYYVESGVKVHAGHFGNPFQQMKHYRSAVFRELTNPRYESLALPEFIRNNTIKFFIHSSLAFTARRFPMDHLKFGTNGADRSIKLWFVMHWMSDLPMWAPTLAFGKNYSLDNEQIERIATQIFRTVQWTEMDDIVQSSEPYGTLYMKIGDQMLPGAQLMNGEVSIGRNPRNAIVIDKAAHPFVSREHAFIRRTTEGIALVDSESTHGTWHNGRKVDSESGVYLTDGDEIVLGMFDEETQKASVGACVMIYKNYAGYEDQRTRTANWQEQ